jgi:hypothetical protein
MKAKILVAGLALAAAAPAFASYTTVDISTYVNGSVAIAPDSFPIGTSTGNQGSGIPFQTAPNPNDPSLMGTWLAPSDNASLVVDLSGLDITGQASFYALLNNYYGTPGADEYNITITATNGDHVSYMSIGGVDTRDYNQNVFTNTIASTTFPWFDNGHPDPQRLDLREFTLPTSFAADTIASFTITQNNNGDIALFSGLTFSDEPIVTSVPEPGSLAMLLAGVGMLAVGARRRWPGRRADR